MNMSKMIRWILVVSAAVVLGYFGWQQFQRSDHSTKAQQNAASSPRVAAVPVTVAAAGKTDFPVYLTGLGTVQGFNTVLVRTRVDGRSIKSASRKVSWSIRAICSPK